MRLLRRPHMSVHHLPLSGLGALNLYYRVEDAPPHDEAFDVACVHRGLGSTSCRTGGGDSVPLHHRKRSPPNIVLVNHCERVIAQRRKGKGYKHFGHIFLAMNRLSGGGRDAWSAGELGCRLPGQRR